MAWVLMKDSTRLAAPLSISSRASLEATSWRLRVCWYRVTYEDNGVVKRLEGGCKSDQACKDAQGQNRDVNNAQSNNCREAAQTWGNSRIIGREAVCNYCVERASDGAGSTVVASLNAAIT